MDSIEILIAERTLTAHFELSSCPGDYWTPPDFYFSVNSIEDSSGSDIIAIVQRYCDIVNIDLEDLVLEEIKEQSDDWGC
tara:strand:+ start:440 stop:679 length:240 start_codon:yes stop_codon:yes gene_type:complete